MPCTLANRNVTSRLQVHRYYDRVIFKTVRTRVSNAQCKDSLTSHRGQINSRRALTSTPRCEYLAQSILIHDLISPAFYVPLQSQGKLILRTGRDRSGVECGLSRISRCAGLKWRTVHAANLIALYPSVLKR